MTQKNRQDQLFSGPTNFDGDATFDGAATFTGQVTLPSTVAKPGEQIIIPVGAALAGATAGWVITGADDGLARLPASQTSSTLVVPIPGIKVGDTVQAVRAIGQVESAGGNVTLVMSVRKALAAVADFTDSELDTDNVGTLTADTLISASVLEVTALAEVMTELELIYILLTGTTAASTDIALSSLIVTVDRA